MEVIDRLNLLSSDMDLEPAEDVGCPKLSERQKTSIVASQAQLPNGRTISLLKTLLTSTCERNCFYCPFRAGRDFRRATFQPDEMAHAFMAVQRAGIVQGLFLSSGVFGGGMHTQDKIIATAELLRNRYQFKGYLHLKLMPGAEKDQVLRTMQLADRVSVNLEAPNGPRLEKLAPRKTFMEELLQPLRWVEEIRRSQPDRLGWKGRWPSMTTQFVVGAAGESDLELLTTSAYLLGKLRLARTYYSAFRPIEDTPFEDLPAESPRRQLRLYQASFLLRDYGFGLEDLPFEGAGALPLHTDPKLAWAKMNLAERPVEINRADRQDLLKVPGIGPKSADAILTARRQGQLREPEQLRKLGVNPSRATPYITLGGRSADQQLRFW